MKASVFVGSMMLTLGVSAAWWIGTANSDPMQNWNWYDAVPTENDTIFVNDGAEKSLVISDTTDLACQCFRLGVDQHRMDNTVVVNGGRVTVKGDLSIGYLNSSGGTVTQNGGTLVVSDRFNVAFGENSEGAFRMTGGTLTVNHDFIINEVETAKGRFEMTGGTINLASGKSLAVPKRGDGTATVSGASAVIDFNGAYLYLAAARSWYNASEGRGVFTLSDGATLKNCAAIWICGPESAFICAGGVIVCGQAGALFTLDGKLYVGDGGIVIDTQGYDVSLGKPMRAAEGATAGGLVKRGAGTLTLPVGNTCLPGPISIEAGRVVAYAPDALPGWESLSLAEGATLELGAGWEPSQVAAIRALSTVRGEVVRTSPLAVGSGDVTIAEDLTAANVAAGDVANPKTGDSALYLTGHNDFGGQFAVEHGTLAANWGEGIAWTDNLRLGAVDSFNSWRAGKFAPLDGLVTNAVGMGAGEIFFPANAEAGFAAAVQPTVVRLYDDATRVLKVNVDVPRLLNLNAATLANDLHFQNPVELNASPSALDIRVDAGHAWLDGGIDYTVDGVPSTAAGSLAKKGDQGTLHMPAKSTFQVLYSQGGTIVYPANSETTLGWIHSTEPTAVTVFGENSKLTLNTIRVSNGLLFFHTGCEVIQNGGTVSPVAAGTLVVSNSTYTMTGAKGDLFTDGTEVILKGGSFENRSSDWTYTRNKAHLTLDGVTAKFASSLIAGYDKSGTNFCGQGLVRITGGAQVTLPELVAMNGDLEISGEGTRIVCGATFGSGTGNELACTNNAASRISMTGGTLQVGGDIIIAGVKGSESQFFLSGGVIEMADGKSFVTDCGNGLFEISGGLLDASRAHGIMLLPQWWNSKNWTDVKPGWFERCVLRFVGGEARVRQVTGVDGRDCQVAFDGGTVTFTNPNSTTIFGGMAVRQIGIHGGVVDTQDRNLTMAGAFTALTNQTPAAVAGEALNTAPAFAKAGSGTLTMVGANTYSCGTEARAGTLALQSGASFPAGQFLRVAADAAIDLGGNDQTVTALLGTGVVKAGALTVTDAIYPAGVSTVGTLTLTDVAPAGRVVIDVAADGACDRLVVNGTLDASRLTIDFADEDALAKQKFVRIVEATAITGRPEVVGLPRNYALSVTGTTISASRQGVVLYVR